MVSGALFLDRDGVLNERAPDGEYIRGPDQLRLLPGIGEALATLRVEVPDLRIAVVTNQRGIALGILSPQALAAAHARLQDELAAAGTWVDLIEVCPHDEGACDCRKPGIGLFEKVLRAWPDVSAVRSAMVGDSDIDIIAGRRFGARTYLVGEPWRRSREAAAARDLGARPDEEAPSLAALVAGGRLVTWLRDGRHA